MVMSISWATPFPASDGCEMITEEVVQGPGAVAFRDKDPSALHRGHEIWLKGLKQVSENKTQEPVPGKTSTRRAESTFPLSPAPITTRFSLLSSWLLSGTQLFATAGYTKQLAQTTRR